MVHTLSTWYMIQHGRPIKEDLANGKALAAIDKIGDAELRKRYLTAYKRLATASTRAGKSVPVPKQPDKPKSKKKSKAKKDKENGKDKESAKAPAGPPEGSPKGADGFLKQ